MAWWEYKFTNKSTGDVHKKLKTFIKCLKNTIVFQKVIRDFWITITVLGIEISYNYKTYFFYYTMIDVYNVHALSPSIKILFLLTYM